MFNSAKVVENINRIHFLLKENFDEVSIVESSNKSDFYFHIDVKKTTPTDTGSRKTYQMKAKIFKESLVRDSFKWFYATNPLSEKTSWIERESHLNSLCLDLLDVINFERLDESYLSSIKEEYSLVTEQNSNSSDQESHYTKILNTIEQHTRVKDVDLEKKSDGDKLFHKLHYILEGDLSLSEKLIIETQLVKLPEVEYVVFGEKKISLTLS